jgi:hypothetical protein
MSITEKDLEQTYLDGWNECNDYVLDHLNKACDSYERLIKYEQDEKMKLIMRGKVFELTNLIGFFAVKKIKK